MTNQPAGFDWFAYLEKTRQDFIDRFAHLDENEYPDKAAEIKEAKRLQNQDEQYVSATDEMPVSLGNRSVLAPFIDPWSISSDDVRAGIEELKNGSRN